MKIKEYEQLIYESFTYPDYAMADFFSKKQQESGFSKEVFLQGLIDALKRIIDYLDCRVFPPEWTEDKQGNKEYIKNTINLLHVTNNRVPGTIWSSQDLIPVVEALKQEPAGNIHLLTIPTKASPDEILTFWLKLGDNNEKGQPYWESKQEITHFVNQNFEGFSGVPELKEFTSNMNKSEMYQVVWTFLRRYGKYKTKRQYANLLEKNFTQFRGVKNLYGNIKDYSKDHLRRVIK